jgi:hypothetical protein
VVSAHRGGGLGRSHHPCYDRVKGRVFRLSVRDQVSRQEDICLVEPPSSLDEGHVTDPVGDGAQRVDVRHQFTVLLTQGLRYRRHRRFPSSGLLIRT